LLVKRHIPAAIAIAALLSGSAVVTAAIAQPSPAPAAAPATAAPAPAAGAPAAGAVDMNRAKLTFESTCSGCHEPTLATAQRHNRQGWEAVVDRMVGFGLTAPEPQLKEIVDYLTATYPAP
jgi:cytochrome c5